MAVALLLIAVVSIVYLHPFGGGTSRHILQGAAGSPTPAQLDSRYAAAYDFVTPSLGWALVMQDLGTPIHFWVFQTGDGARHWRQQFAGQCSNVATIDLHMFDKQRGVIDLCNPMVLYRTADGGASWDSARVPAYSPAYLTFVDPLHGWFLGLSLERPPALHSLTTADGGASWSELPEPPLPAFGAKGLRFNMSFRDALAGWIGGATVSQSTVFSTGDGGRSWHAHVLPGAPVQPIPFNGPLQAQAQVELLPGTGVFAITTDPAGAELASTSLDGGSTWRSLPAPPGETRFDDYVFIDAVHWWAMRYGTLFKSSDAGRTWKLAAQQLDSWDYLPHIIDASHAWAEIAFANPGGAGGGLATTSDGGVHWTYVSVPTPPAA
jgi:photosystem II stability/assembly factor-like uncharacterized protein